MNIKRFSAIVALVALAISCTVAQVAAKSHADAYEKWLDEDVVYIITPHERAEYLRLTTDKNRDHFIVDFWLKRDPTPETPENEFKEEHYRRIAYSNEHFADSRRGWSTDRGRVYIVNGPPDEIKNLPAQVNGGPARPTQVWWYKSGKQFRFVDECGCGEYRQQLPSLDYGGLSQNPRQ